MQDKLIDPNYKRTRRCLTWGLLRSVCLPSAQEPSVRDRSTPSAVKVDIVLQDNGIFLPIFTEKLVWYKRPVNVYFSWLRSQ